MTLILLVVMAEIATCMVPPPDSESKAVALRKQIKIYPLAKASLPPSMEFLNGSGKTIDTLFPNNFHYFELFAKLVDDWQISAF
jgi:hypothetical protein